MFIKIFRSPNKDGTNLQEVLFNVNHITKIVVEYYAPNDKGDLWLVDYHVAKDNPSAKRTYILYFGNERVELDSNPDSNVLKKIETIYKDANKD